MGPLSTGEPSYTRSSQLDSRHLAAASGAGLGYSPHLAHDFSASARTDPSPYRYGERAIGAVGAKQTADYTTNYCENNANRSNLASSSFAPLTKVSLRLLGLLPYQVTYN